MKYINRKLEKILLQAAGQFPAIVLTGPRQTGKSTLLKHLFPDYSYITLDDIGIREIATADPAMFVSSLKKPVIIDEIQYVPKLLSYIKIHIDNERKNGYFIITGSQIFSLMQGLGETLAGRAALFELLHFSFSEIGKIPHSPAECYKQILKGFYPVPNTQKTDLGTFYGSYLSTYIERDVRQIRYVQDIGSFQRFIRLLASRAGIILNIQSLASDCGISSITAKKWLSILESSRIIYLLKPYFSNKGKRLIKSPKIYFTDTGLLAYLLRYRKTEELMAGAIAGAIFENMVVMEALKETLYNRSANDLYFYRDSNNVEADLVIDRGNSFSLYEIKASQTLQSGFAKNLKLLSISPAEKKVLTLNETEIPIYPGITAAPWHTIIKDCSPVFS